MKILTALKIVIALAVLAVVGFTSMLAWHIAVEPLGGVFEKLVPETRPVVATERDEDFVRALEATEAPVIDPGERVFREAHEMIVLGQTAEAREKLGTIIHVYPTSSTAPVARRILGDMRLDELLTTSSLDGKIDYTVVRGDSLLGIVGRHRTTLENLKHINGLNAFGTLKPGDKFILMPLDFRMIITPNKQSLALWREAEFIREYPIIEFNHTRTSGAEKTKIESKAATVNGRRVQALTDEYIGAEKTILLANGITIRPYRENDEARPRGIHLRPIDIEELNLLVRSGNDVEFR
jgi:hypothetical protein